jgi:hypothetical protein
MGKMKALLIDQEEVQEDQDEHDVVSLQQEAHYVHTVNEFVDLIVEHGYGTVMNDLYLKLIKTKGW